jgi:integrase/recombinase XerD
MKPLKQARFDNPYQIYINELIFQCKISKTIDCYSRYIRQVAEFFNVYPDHITTEELKIYFLFLVEHKPGVPLKLLAMLFNFSKNSSGLVCHYRVHLKRSVFTTKRKAK